MSDTSLFPIVDAKVRRQGRKSFLVNASMLTMLLASLTLIGLRVPPEQAVSSPKTDPRVVQLQQQADRKERELGKWRELFAYCRTAGNWSDDRCGATGSPKGSLTPVTVVNQRRNDNTGSDSDNGGDVNVTVRPQTTTPTHSTATPPPSDNSSDDLTDTVGEQVDKVSGVVDDLTGMVGATHD